MRERVTKKQLAVEMHERGMNVSAIAELLRTEPSYVANALIERGYVPNYMDLYTSTGPQNEHAALLAGVLRFRDVEAARTSVSKIEALFNDYDWVGAFTIAALLSLLALLTLVAKAALEWRIGRRGGGLL